MNATSWTDAQTDRAIAAIDSLPDIAAVRAFQRNVDVERTSGRINSSKAEMIRHAIWRRIATLSSQGEGDSLTQRWHQALAVYEALTGKKATRTRPMLARHGARRAFERLVNRASQGGGFEQMVAAGLHEMTAEWIVLEHRAFFDTHVLEMAEHKLVAAGVTSRPSLPAMSPQAE